MRARMAVDSLLGTDHVPLVVTVVPAVDWEHLSGTLRKVVPYSAVIYDLHGETWVYMTPSPFTYVRRPGPRCRGEVDGDEWWGEMAADWYADGCRFGRDIARTGV